MEKIVKKQSQKERKIANNLSGSYRLKLSIENDFLFLFYFGQKQSVLITAIFKSRATIEVFFVRFHAVNKFVVGCRRVFLLI
jgi:hypothetical protein